MDGAPNKTDFDNMASYRQARKDFVEKIKKLKPGPDPVPEILETMQLLTKRIIQLEEIVARKNAVTLENGRTYTLETADHLSLALAAIVAARGQRVDLALRSGEVIENLRIGEVVQIAIQLQEGGSQESDKDESVRDPA